MKNISKSSLKLTFGQDDFARPKFRAVLVEISLDWRINFYSVPQQRILMLKTSVVC